MALHCFDLFLIHLLPSISWCCYRVCCCPSTYSPRALLYGFSSDALVSSQSHKKIYTYKLIDSKYREWMVRACPVLDWRPITLCAPGLAPADPCSTLLGYKVGKTVDGWKQWWHLRVTCDLQVTRVQGQAAAMPAWSEEESASQTLRTVRPLTLGE